MSRKEGLFLELVEKLIEWKGFKFISHSPGGGETKVNALADLMSGEGQIPG
jgi:hypothetical protein